jgi:hypothetical protein
MPARPITDAFVRNVRAPDLTKRVAYIDTLERGLALLLVVSYGGTKTFRALTYRNGKARTRKLGSYPQMSVKDARAKAPAYWENPLKFEEKAAVGTFKQVAENWIKRYVDVHQLRSKSEIERILKNICTQNGQIAHFLRFGAAKSTNCLITSLMPAVLKKATSGRTKAGHRPMRYCQLSAPL